MTYTLATRKGSYVVIGVDGHSGSGKTFSSLLLARGLVGPKGKIAVLDTETGRASLCAHVTDFDVDELRPPFTPARYIEKIKDAAAAGYHCLIIDSASHEWEGEGGILDMADNEKYQSGQSKQGLAKWAGPKSKHKKFINEMLLARMHVIICMRAKDKMIQGKDNSGRETIVCAGTVPIQDRKIIFELTISLKMNEETKFPTVRKCPDDLAGAFPQGQFITEESGKKIAEWIGGGLPVDEDLERLQQTARDVASLGRERMTQHWESLSKKDQKSLEPILPDLRSMADAADEQTAEPESKKAPEDPLDDSFTGKPGITDKGGDPVNPLG